MTTDLRTAGIPAGGFALLELLLALLMLTLAIASIGTSALHVMRLEKELIADAETWRVSRSVSALHQAGLPFEMTAAYARGRGWLLSEIALEAPEKDAPAGWSIWRIESPGRTGLSFPARFIPPAKLPPAGASAKQSTST